MRAVHVSVAVAGILRVPVSAWVSRRLPDGRGTKTHEARRQAPPGPLAAANPPGQLGPNPHGSQGSRKNKEEREEVRDRKKNT